MTSKPTISSGDAIRHAEVVLQFLFQDAKHTKADLPKNLRRRRRKARQSLLRWIDPEAAVAWPLDDEDGDDDEAA